MIVGVSPSARRLRWRGEPTPWWGYACGAVIVGLAIYRLCFAPAASAPETLDEGAYTVRYVVDGDTLQLTNGARVRLMGVNTPETVKPNHPVEPFGPEAKEFTDAFVSGHEVRLQLDNERVDRYGRFLAFVWVGDRMLNEELVRAGLARYEPNFFYASSIKTRYRHAQEEARAASRGIWSLAE